jgi:hypothetical protein
MLAQMRIEPHPLLAVAAFTTHFASSLGELGAPPYITVLLTANADVPVERNENVRQKVRDVLRHSGYKPTGRGKPASEYLAGATAERRLSNINLAVDICNAVSLHSGLPISVVDSAKLRGPVRVAVATPQSKPLRSMVCPLALNTYSLCGVATATRTGPRSLALSTTLMGRPLCNDTALQMSTARLMLDKRRSAVAPARYSLAGLPRPVGL